LAFIHDKQLVVLIYMYHAKIRLIVGAYCPRSIEREYAHFNSICGLLAAREIRCVVLTTENYLTQPDEPKHCDKKRCKYRSFYEVAMQQLI